jgi:hypothetical protein
MPRIRTIILCILAILSTSVVLSGGWQAKNTLALPVSLAGGNSSNQQVVSDGVNGFFAVWQDRRDGSIDRLYAQHIDASGDTLWTANGTRLSYGRGYQFYPQVIADGTNGFIVVWQDDRNGTDYDIYAQRIDFYGDHLWGQYGTLVCGATGNQYYPKLVSDGSGGAIFVWQDHRGAGYSVYAQHLNSSGSATWNANGIQVCATSADQTDPEITSGGSGGAIVVWTDYRTPANGSDIYAQSVHANGTLAWPASGLPVCASTQSQSQPQVVSDGLGGAIFTWEDIRNSSTYQIYAQHLTSSGSAVWTGNGVQVCPTAGNEVNQSTVADGNGGAAVVWEDNRSGIDYDIYAQHLNGVRGPVWASGAPVCISSGTQENPQVAIDHGSILVTWEDLRVAPQHSVYCQNLDTTAGGVRWQLNGVLAYQSSADQVFPQLVADGAQGCIVVWGDYGSGDGSTNLLGQRIGANGLIGGGAFRTFMQNDYAEKSVTYWSKAKGGYLLPTVGNVLDSVFKHGAYPSGLTIGISRADSSKVYGWVEYGNSTYIRAAVPQSGLSKSFDSLNGKLFTDKLTNPNLTKLNEGLVGEAVTLNMNIALGDFGLTDLKVGDLIYNNPMNPDPLNGKSLRQISGYIDSALTMWKLYRGVSYSGLDSTLHAINNAFAGAIDTITASPLKIAPVRPVFNVPFLFPAPAPPAPGRATMKSAPVGERTPSSGILLQNYPNPFNPTTKISFNLNSAAVVTLRVYNILGQEVRRLFDHATLGKGLHVAVFDGTNLASGLYFYHLETGSGADGADPVSVIKKMMLLK